MGENLSEFRRKEIFLALVDAQDHERGRHRIALARACRNDLAAASHIDGHSLFDYHRRLLHVNRRTLEPIKLFMEHRHGCHPPPPHS